MEDIIELVLSFGFTEGETDMFYYLNDGFLFTVSFSGKVPYLAINLPKISKSEQSSIRTYIKETVPEARRISFTKFGVEITLSKEFFKKSSKLSKFISGSTDFIVSLGIEFAEQTTLLDVAGKHMYTFISRERATTKNDISKNNIFGFTSLEDVMADKTFDEETEFENSDISAAIFEEDYSDEADSAYDGASLFEKENNSYIQNVENNPEINPLKFETPDEQPHLENNESIEYFNDEIIDYDLSDQSEHDKLIINEAASKIKEDPEQMSDDIPEPVNSHGNKFISFLSENTVLVFAFAAVLFFLLSVTIINIASVAGYLIGVSVTYLLSKNNSDHIVIKVLGCSLLTLFISSFASFLYSFLAQSELYTVQEYIEQSLMLSQCLFNAVLGFIFAAFGMYSSLPPTKKKQQSDFN